MVRKTDVIDWDEHRTGERKEGSYFAAWAFVAKLASGLMIGLVGLTLDRVGFVAGVDQAPEVKRAMVFLMGGMPVIGFAVGIAAFTRFRLTRAEHERIRGEIEARASAD